MEKRKLILATGMGYPQSTEEQIPMIARAGFDGVFTGWADGAPICEWAKIVRDHGMYYQSLHAPFNRANLMWEPGNGGDDAAAGGVAFCRGLSPPQSSVSPPAEAPGGPACHSFPGIRIWGRGRRRPLPPLPVSVRSVSLSSAILSLGPEATCPVPGLSRGGCPGRKPLFQRNSRQ